MRVLVVEDDSAIAEVVRRGLAAEGHVVDVERDGPGGLFAALERDYDVVVLDIMLPRLNGYDVLKHLRAREVWTPVLMLTAKDGEYDQEDALDLGADDYLTKPFRMRELVARVRALLRRVERARELAASPGVPVSMGSLVLDGRARRVSVDGSEVHLTPLEFDLLAALARTPDAVCTRESLMAEVWGWSDASGTRTLDSHVKSLRAKIGPERVRTVHGVGYALQAPGPSSVTE